MSARKTSISLSRLLPSRAPLAIRRPAHAWEDSHQSSGIVQDRIHLPGRIQLLAGGRYDSLRDNNYSLPQPARLRRLTVTDRLLWLPQYAVTFNPVENLTLYGNYGVLLSLGPQAPWWVDNASQFLRRSSRGRRKSAPSIEPGQRILLTAAFFHMRAPFFYPKVIAGVLTAFVRSESVRAISALNPRAARRTTASS